jgi:hypothetical protein
MDTPQVDAGLLAESAAPLLNGAPVDALLGPATDGGWWALGLRDPLAAVLITDVPTSRADTGERTLHALRAAGLRVGLLPTLTDVDTAEDALTVRVAAPGTRFAAAVDAIPALRSSYLTVGEQALVARRDRAPARTAAGPARTGSRAAGSPR